MNRLQKKCLIAAAGTHLLIVVVVLCSGFITSQPKPDDLTLLTMIPTTAIDAAFKSGVKDAQPPPPKPDVKPTEPIPLPPPPQPVVHLVEPPKPVELVKPVEPVKPPTKTQPDIAKPADNPVKPPPPKHEIKPDLNTVVRSKPTVPDTSAADAARDKLAREQRAKELQQIARNLQNNFAPATEIEMPGDSSASYANYGAIVVSVYHHAWVPPENMVNDADVVKFSVAIDRDGTVISAHIVTSSGDASVDKAVERMLDRVTFIHKFPDDTKDRERDYEIDFNATRTNIQ